MADKSLPSPEALRQLLRYEPSTGKLFWRERASSMFAISGDAARWNGRHAGAEAFTGVHRQGYRQGQVYRRTLRAHRVIWAMHYGNWPVVIDHIDGDVSNNRLANLRNVTQAINNRNSGMRRDNTSGHVGVRWHKANGKWISVLSNKYLGSFDKIEDAVAARKAAQAAAGFHENHGRS